MVNNLTKEKKRSNRSRIKTVYLNRGENDFQLFIKKREECTKSSVENSPRKSFKVTYDRKTVKENRKELQINRIINQLNEIGNSSSDYIIDMKDGSEKRREKEIEKRRKSVKYIRKYGWNEKKQKSDLVKEWKEQVARVGTGYRVRRDDKDSQKRRFDVGYADLKVYKRKEGREVVVDKSNMGRTLMAKGEDARVKVINAVCAIEKRRPASEYTGSGILRKSIVGKLKLKPTKAGEKK